MNEDIVYSYSEEVCESICSSISVDKVVQFAQERESCTVCCGGVPVDKLNFFLLDPKEGLIIETIRKLVSIQTKGIEDDDRRKTIWSYITLHGQWYKQQDSTTTGNINGGGDICETKIANDQDIVQATSYLKERSTMFSKESTSHIILQIKLNYNNRDSISSNPFRASISIDSNFTEVTEESVVINFIIFLAVDGIETMTSKISESQRDTKHLFAMHILFCANEYDEFNRNWIKRWSLFLDSINIVWFDDVANDDACR